MTGFTTVTSRPPAACLRSGDAPLPASSRYAWGWAVIGKAVCRVISSRVVIGALLAMFVVAAHADGEQAFSPLAYAEIVQDYGSLPNASGLGRGKLVAPHRPQSISLAESGDQIHRVDAAPVGGSIAVVYPDLGEPYRSIFATIVEGIENKAKLPVRSYPLADETGRGDLNAQMKRDGIRVVIALGRQGLKATAGLDRSLPVVVGGVLAVPDMESANVLSISLTPDPALLFAHLKDLLPNVKRVFVIYNPHYNDWLIKLARDEAKAQGLELVAYEARDLATAARLYQSVFASSDARHDALWLPQDATTVDESTILPLVLRESWNRGLPVFSSSFLHVKKGALFALYPNNLELGKTLAVTAQNVLSGESRRHGVLPLREVQTAVNLRTANHIGLNIGYQQQRDFDFIFPEP